MESVQYSQRGLRAASARDQRRQGEDPEPPECCELNKSNNRQCPASVINNLKLLQVIQEIFDLEKSIDFIKKLVIDKEGYLRVAQTRLETRTRRPGVESKRDQAMQRFVSGWGCYHSLGR